MAISPEDKIVRGSDLAVIGSILNTVLDAKATVESYTVNESADDGGINTLTLSMSDGSTISIGIRNGRQGNSGYSGAASDLEVVNNFTDGGTTAALSAEMGKVLYNREVFLTEAEYEALSTIDPDVIYNIYEEE